MDVATGRPIKGLHLDTLVALNVHHLREIHSAGNECQGICGTWLIHPVGAVGYPRYFHLVRPKDLVACPKDSGDWIKFATI